MLIYRKVLLASSLLVLSLLSGTPVLAQSSDQSLPTPITSNEVRGTIAPLDVGDPRLTRHFYAFEADAGDLIATMDSRNLNGDIDVFTAVTFRPLMKTTMYASVQAPEVTKSIYLRTHQILILRIEARTPNDDPGSYQIRFRGSFQPFSSGIPVAQATEANTTDESVSRGTKRVSSVGATIEEPRVEIAAKPEPTPEPQPSPSTIAKESSEKPVAAEESKPETKKSSTGKSSARVNTRNPRGRSTARSRPAASSKGAKSDSENKSSTTNTTSDKGSENPKREVAVVTEGKPSSDTKSTKEKAASQDLSLPQPNARLIIEEKDGTRIERPMSTVRRFVIEGNTILIVLKTGRIERISMSSVSRVAIEP